MDIRSLLPEQDTFTADEVAKVFEGMKLADLNSGEYVKKEKLDAALKAKAEAVAELNDLRAATDGDAGLKAQVELLQAKLDAAEKQAGTAAQQLERRERIDALTAKGISPKLAELAVIKAESRVSEDTDFDAALTSIMDGDPDYAPSTEPKPTAKVSTGTESTGTAPKPKSALMEALEAKIG